MTARRAVALLILAATIVPAWPARIAWACSCIRASRSEHVEDASAIFVGVAGGRERIEGATMPFATRFAVEVVYKGDLEPGSEVSILHATQGTACGLPFPEGERFTIFVNEFEGSMLTSTCSLTRRGAIPADRLGLPRPTEVVPVPPEQGSASRLPWVIGVSFGVVAVAVGVALKRRAHTNEAQRPSV